MSSMDLKGINWVGHVYEKFEAMCLEVEEVMYQDTVKYVENQVQNVGASVKKFYSDVMEDLLLPSSLDPVKKVAGSESSVQKFPGPYKSPNSSLKLKEEILRVDNNALAEELKVTVHSIRDVNNTPYGDGLQNEDKSSHLSPENFCSGSSSIKSENERPPAEPREVTCIKEDCGRTMTFCGNINENHAASCQKTAVISSAVLCDSRGENFDEIESSSESIPDLPNDDSSSVETLLDKEMEMRCSSVCTSEESSGICTDARMVFTVSSSANTQVKGSSVDEATYSPYQGGSNDWTMNVMKSNTIAGQEDGIIKQVIKTQVEDSVVMVDGNELAFLPLEDGKRRPYKKKICDAISSRMRSVRKKKYEQVASWFDSSMESDMDGEPSSMPSQGDNKKRPLSCDFLESDWEIL